MRRKCTPIAMLNGNLVSIFVIALFATTSFAQQPKVLAPHDPIPQRVPESRRRPLPPAKAGSVIGGLWMTDANFKATLHLRNLVETSPVTVTPVLHLSNGNSYTLPAEQLEAAGTKVVDINAGLQSLGIASYATLSGYVEVQYNWPWNPICATVRDVDVAHSVVFSYGLAGPPNPPRNTSPTAAPATTTTTTAPLVGAMTVQGMWWKQEPNVTGFVALANTSAQAVTAALQVSDALANPIAQHSVTISPHGMKMVDLTELQSATGTSGGITVTYTGSHGDLIINGGLEDQDTGYSANLLFASLTPSATEPEPSIAELGLMAGAADPMMNFPAGTTFTPYSVLRNISTGTISVTPTLWWMAGGAPQSAQLPAIHLAPSQSQNLNVPSLLAAAGLKNYNGSVNLVFDVQGKRGSLILAAGSVDQKNTYVFGIVPTGILKSASKSLSYWSTANGDDTMVTLWNPADEAQDLIFRLDFTGGHYNYALHLGPRATQTMNISEIINNQVPDAEGNLIPPNVHEGSAKLMGSHDIHEHILVAMDAGTYNVQRATCYVYCLTCDGTDPGGWIQPSSLNVDVDGEVPVALYGYYDDSLEDQVVNVDWSVGNSAILSLSGNSVVGVAAGTTWVQGYAPNEPNYTYNDCSEEYWMCPETYGVWGSTNGSVGDGTPVISTITSPWNAGVPNSVTINGQHFGTNAPTINISPSSGITYSLVSYGDSQIVATVTVAPATPTEGVSVGVTSNGYAGSSFQSVGGSTSGSNSVPVTVHAIQAPTPRILFNGTDVTGTTQNVVVGQQIALSTTENLPGGVAITSNNWTIPGTVVGGFNVTATSGTVTPVNLSQSATTFYWVFTASAISVQYSYCMTNSQCSAAAQATFNVTGPQGAQIPSPTLPPWAISPVGTCPAGGTDYFVVFGTLAGTICAMHAPTGAIFTGSVSSQPSGGTLWWGQLLLTNTIKVTTSGGTQTSNCGTGLDKQFPAITGGTFSDAPNTQLLSSDLELVKSFSAQLFLLWTSNLSSSIPVPLGSITWTITADAVQTNGVFSLKSSSSGAGQAGSFVPSSSSQPFYGFPTWGNVIVGGC